MAGYTNNYQLHQWEPGDNFLRTDFNEDLAKIDAELKERCQVVFGSYVGNADSSDSGTIQHISLGVQPKLAVVLPSSGLPCQPGYGGAFLGYGGMCAPGQPAYSGGDSSTWTIQMTEDGFDVRNCGSMYVNGQGRTYYYLVLK